MGEFAVKRRVFALGFAPGALAAAALALVASVLSVASSAASAADPPASGILLSVEPAAVSEGSGTTEITVTALVGTTETLVSPTDVTVSVTGGSSGGQATSGTDFTAVTNFAINLAAGDTSATGSFNLVVSDDTTSEGPETITVSGTTTASLTVTPGALTINDDDKAPAMNATGCTDGTHVTNPTSNAGLVADCQNLVAARNHWTNHSDNVNLAHNHNLRNWTGNITTWPGIIITANSVNWLLLPASANASQRIGGTIPAQLGNLQHLQYLLLDGNRLTGEIPTQLGNLKKLIYLNLNDNQLTGAIPAQLGNLANLAQLWLSDNRLTGAIPTQLGNLATLQRLLLDGNRLTGEIPTQLGNLANLYRLDLNGNQLSGAIPTQLGSFTNLERLLLNDNRLTGEIPTELGNLANLKMLYLSNNRLTGAIPAQLGALSKLSVFWFCQNYLTGAVPIQLRAGVTLDFTGDYTDIRTCRRPSSDTGPGGGGPPPTGPPPTGPPPTGPPPTGPEPEPSLFQDDDGSSHEAAVNALARAGITRGCAPTRFCPNRPITRAQIAVLIYRSVAYRTGTNPPQAGRVTLTDVPAGSAWHDAAQWAASSKVVSPTPDGEFNPAGGVTRADAAVALAAALEHLNIDNADQPDEPQNLFTDVEGLPATTVIAMETLHRHRITLGCSADPLRFCPNRPITRAQLATMLARILGLTPTPETP